MATTLDDLVTLTEPTYAGWLTEASRATLAAYRTAGFPIVCIDCQHSEIDESQAAAMVRSGLGRDLTVLVRVSDSRPSVIGMVLDAGADGVIVPDVDDAAGAAKAVAATRYPPRGKRSFGPTRDDLPRDVHALEARSACVLMLETRAGLENVDEICAVEGLAGLLVGPGDLSIALGLPLSDAFSSNQLDAAMARIGAACRRNGIVFGAYATDAESARRWAAHGCHLIPVGSGARLLQAAARDLWAALPQGDPDLHRSTPIEGK